MKMLNAVVKFPAGKTITTQYGERVNAVFTVGEEEIKIWAEANSSKAEKLKGLKRGEQVLVIDDNGKYKLLESEPQATIANGNGNEKTKPEYEPIPDDKKRAIATYITEIGKLYGYCLTQAQSIAPSGLPPEAVKDIASTLFITTQKKFNL